MKPDYPAQNQIPHLRTLWKEAFGDTDEFLDLFFHSAYDPRRCRCIAEADRALAALYWFDVTCEGQKFAYIYAVATANTARGQGLCRTLMDDTAKQLKSLGYHGTLLHPQDAGLRIMYGKMGYRNATTISQSLCAAGEEAIPVTEITAEEYAARRLEFLPPVSVIQEKENLSFLSALARLYTAPGMIAAVSLERGHLRILECLGDSTLAPGLVAALGAQEATLRCPGADQSFAMYLPLTPECVKPEYFGFPFD